MNQEFLSQQNIKFQDKYKVLEETLVEYEECETDDADVILVSFGISSRISFSAMQQLRRNGIRAGLLRPKTLFPFPRKRLRELAGKTKKLVVVELNSGHMADDVELAACGQCPVLRYNWYGGIIPTTGAIVDKVTSDMAGR
jgi:pyruvate/2-oxoacid:ferredoxin oxidoreductase alpha subunit